MRLVPGLLALCVGILFHLGVHASGYAFSAGNSADYNGRGPLTEEALQAEPRSFINEKSDELSDDALRLSVEQSAFDSDKERVLGKKALMGSGATADAKTDFDQTGSPALFISFSPEGTALFERITAQNIGRRLAIVLDNAILSTPTINEKISGGKVTISGNFTIQDAHDLVVQLCAGSLPQPFTILENRVIAPAVGKGVGS